MFELGTSSQNDWMFTFGLVPCFMEKNHTNCGLRSAVKLLTNGPKLNQKLHESNLIFLRMENGFLLPSSSVLTVSGFVMSL